MKTRNAAALGLIIGTVALAGAAYATPTRYTVESVAMREGGCEIMTNRRISLVSQSNGYPPQYVFQVECHRALQQDYVIVVCRGDFECRLMR